MEEQPRMVHVVLQMVIQFAVTGIKEAAARNMATVVTLQLIAVLVAKVVLAQDLLLALLQVLLLHLLIQIQVPSLLWVKPVSLLCMLLSCPMEELSFLTRLRTILKSS